MNRENIRNSLLLLPLSPWPHNNPVPLKKESRVILDSFSPSYIKSITKTFSNLSSSIHSNNLNTATVSTLALGLFPQIHPPHCQ